MDTRTGNLSVMLEENYCFDAEVYADEIDIPEQLNFRDDQRSNFESPLSILILLILLVNLGKWVLRNLFSTLLDEEIKRDEIYRRTFRSGGRFNYALQRDNVPPRISLPKPGLQTSNLPPDSDATPRPMSGIGVPPTPGMAIGVATPLTQSALHGGQLTSILPATLEEDSELERRPSGQSAAQDSPDRSSDYFNHSNIPSEAPSESGGPAGRLPATPSEEKPPTNPASPTDEKEEKKRSTLFGKNFKMAFPKKLGRNSADAKQIIANGEKQEDQSDKSSEREDKVIEDNFYGVIQRIRQDYRDQAEAHQDQPLTMGITPSLPIETPVLRPPLNTTIIIQEDNPESGGTRRSL